MLKLNSSLVPQWGTYIESSGTINASVITSCGINILSNTIYVIGAANNDLTLSGAPSKPSGSGNYGTYLIKYTV